MVTVHEYGHICVCFYFIFPEVGFKRRKTDKEPGSSKGAKKNRRTKDEIEHRLSPIVSEGSSDEQSTIVSEEEAVAEEGIAYKEPTTYDNLLKTLSGKESFANLYKRRQREEEGKSDTEEDAGLEYFSTSEEDDDGREGTDKESPGSVGMRTNPQDSGWSSVIEKSEEIAIDDDEDSEPDEELDLEVNCQSAPEASVSSFSDHLGYKLSKTEVDNLSKRKWKYKWEMPASDMPSCKWTGSGECFIKDVDLNSGYGLKLKLYKHWLDIYKACGGHDFHSSKQRYFLSLFNSYQDILHHNKKPFYLKGMEEDSSIMDAYLMHSVLILLPLASIAFRVVKRLIRLTPSSQKVNVEHLDRFSDEYGTGVADNNDNEDNDFEDGQSQKTSKPPDFQALFGGNNNDHFMIGIKFTRRSIKLYGDFYSSDMIVASPLGLITNWSHVDTVLEQLNHIPSKQHGTDIMRIRPWYLDGHAQFYRQTIILGSYLNPVESGNKYFERILVRYFSIVESL
ncbi:hypothetical protein Acr_13g0002800 [Actinidia rufa]|uniref:UTP25 NTP hydrolase-like domain-containing protein n=1 Tax=Actinidia rufa TaxID=165716 RepID=A0A7J0FL35_9ERIC|nr:hypothetical protein Acr_13g0002800 [Actinidia rufa]